MLRIADKYNFTQLFDSLDSHFAQTAIFNLNAEKRRKGVKIATSIVQLINKTALPKTAAMFFHWKQNDCFDLELVNDDDWSKLVNQHPDFAKISALVSGRKDYLSWNEQHNLWMVNFSEGEDDCGCVIIGPMGQTEGAVKCSPILPI